MYGCDKKFHLEIPNKEYSMDEEFLIKLEYDASYPLIRKNKKFKHQVEFSLYKL